MEEAKAEPYIVRMASLDDETEDDRFIAVQASSALDACIKAGKLYSGYVVDFVKAEGWSE